MGLLGTDEVVGLVIDADSVRAAVVSSARSGVSVSKYVQIAVESGPEADDHVETVVSAIEELFSVNSLSRDNVVVAVNSSDAVLRQVTLPFQDEARIRKTIRFEVEDVLPFALESCVVDYHIGRTREGKTDVLVAALGKSHIADLLAILERCRIDPVAIELDIGAIVNCAGWAGVLEGPAVFADISAEYTRTAIWDGEVVFWRTFRTGTGDAAGVAGKVSSELRRSVLSAGLNDEPAVLYVTGSHQLLSEITVSLGEKTEMRTEKLSSAASVPSEGDVQLEDVLASGASALGCALKLVGFDRSTVDLRQDEFAYKRKLERLMPSLIVLSSLVLVCGLLWNASIHRSGVYGDGEMLRIRDNAVRLWKESGVAEPSPETVRSMASRLQDLIAVKKMGGDDSERVAKRSVLDEWRMFAERIPEDLDVELEEIRIDQKRITIEGNAIDSASAERLKVFLNKGGRFGFELPNTRKNREGRMDFTLRYDYEEDG